MCQLKHHEYAQRETRMDEFLVYDARVVSRNIARFRKEQQRLRAQGGPNFPSAVRVHSPHSAPAFGQKPQWLGGVGVARTDSEVGALQTPFYAAYLAWPFYAAYLAWPF